jgi:hypothetical protein
MTNFIIWEIEGIWSIVFGEGIVFGDKDVGTGSTAAL